MYHLRIFHQYGDISFASKGMQNRGLCFVPIAIELGGTLSCHTCCNMGPLVFQSYIPWTAQFSHLVPQTRGIYSFGAIVDAREKRQVTILAKSSL